MNRRDDKSYILVAYVVLAMFIFAGIGVGWMAHALYGTQKVECIQWQK